MEVGDLLCDEDFEGKRPYSANLIRSGTNPETHDEGLCSETTDDVFGVGLVQVDRFLLQYESTANISDVMALMASWG